MPKKILVIDDEKELADVTRLRLENMGFQATAAYSGSEGVLQAITENYDLVITDYNMPDLNGEEVIDSIQTKKPNLPVALFSVYHDDDSTINRNLRKKAAGIVKKPISTKNLQEVIQRILS